MARSNQDVLAELDHVLCDATGSPWRKPARTAGDVRRYVPDSRMLFNLLAVPIAQGHARRQQSGRVAKSLDAYVAYELRRAGFDANAVFPRARQPRVLAPEVAGLELAVDHLRRALADYEADGPRLRPPSLRRAIVAVSRAFPGAAETEVLGRFYKKQVDTVVLADWLRGPDVLVSGKTMLSSFRNNKNNRYEEAIGEAHNLRDRYPLAAMGFVYLVRSSIRERGAFELLRDLLARLRRPDGPYDATVLLVADWNDQRRRLISVDDPASSLSLSRFFEDLLDAVMTNTPVDVHPEVRVRRYGEPLGGMPPDTDVAADR